MPEKNATLVVKLHKCHIFEKAPSSISDVTIHELAYLQEKNHTKNFGNLSRTRCPTMNKKEWLRVNGPGLTYSKKR